MAHRFTGAAGCFWGTEAFFVRKFGTALSEVQVGYIGGSVANPTYKQVCKGDTGHAQAVTFKFNPNQVCYNDLLKYFFCFHNPTTLNEQGHDSGTHYRSAIFYHSLEQKDMAEKMIVDFNTPGSDFNQKLIKAFGDHSTVVTTVEDGINQKFWRAEDYHQAFLRDNPIEYSDHKIYIDQL